MKVRIYHKDGVSFTVHNVMQITRERKVIIVTYNTGFGKEADYFFQIEEIEKIELRTER